MKKPLASLLTLGVGAVLTASSFLSGSNPAHAQGRPDQVPGEILVGFHPGASGQSIAALHRQNGGRIKAVLPEIDVQVVEVPVGQEAGRIAAYARNPNVVFAEVNGLYHAIDHSVSDPGYPEQWQYNNLGQAGGKNDADIDAYEAWHTATGQGVKIAILDTGIDQDHEDLPLHTKVVDNINFTYSPDAEDRYGHGTHVAGSAAAATNNIGVDGKGIGVAGTAPEAVLANVKVLDDSGSGSWSGIANGITWASNNGAKVISMSLGGSIGSRTLERAVNDAWNKGVVLVAAAGNSGSSAKSYPAAYTNVIAVAATDRFDAKPNWSNYGNRWVDVAAPGADILSTAPNHPNQIWGSNNSGYGVISGTSMATPHVAGIAALVWSTGVKSNTTVRECIERAAEPINGTGKLWSHGRVNANNSVLGVFTH